MASSYPILPNPNNPPTNGPLVGLPSDYANRLRQYPNALIIPSHVSKEEDIDFDDPGLEEKEEEEYIRPRRSAALAASALSASTSSSSSSLLSSSTSSSLNSSSSFTTHSSSSSSSLLPKNELKSSSPSSQVRYAPKKVIARTNYLYYHMLPTPYKHLSARVKEYLVPIKLDLDLDGYKLRDMFLWNLNETLFTPEKFAEIMVQDLDLPNKFIPLIALNIRLQIEESTEQIHTQALLAEWEPDEAVVIDLELVAGRILLRDRFEFDPSLSNPVTPEQFSKLTCAELGLPPELAPLYAATLRDSILRQLKTKPSKSSKRDHGGLFQVGRDSEDWSPVVETLDEPSLEKQLDKDKRELRRHRRLQRSSQWSKLQLNEVMSSLQTMQTIETHPSYDYPPQHQVWKQLLKKLWVCEQCSKQKIDIFSFYADWIQQHEEASALQHPLVSWNKKLETIKLLCDDCQT